MSQRNVDVIRAIQAAWNGGEQPLEHFDPNVEWIAARSGIEGPFRGHAGLLRFRVETFEEFDKFEAHFEQLLDLGERVLVWGAIHVRGRVSGAEMDIPTAGVFGFRDGKITCWRDYGSKEAALEAVGLAQAPVRATPKRQGATPSVDAAD